MQHFKTVILLFLLKTSYGSIHYNKECSFAVRKRAKKSFSNLILFFIFLFLKSGPVQTTHSRQRGAGMAVEVLQSVMGRSKILRWGDAMDVALTFIDRFPKNRRR